MTPRRTFVLLFAVLAAAVGVVFIAISIDHGVYAPGTTALRGKLHAVDPGATSASWYGLSIKTALRKAYSVLAFAIVGFFAAPLVARTVRLRFDVLLVAGFSTVIEIVQKVTGSRESFGSNLFDIACGALGGLIGAAVWNALEPHLPRLRDGGS